MYYIRYNYMFRRLTMAIFRLYTKYLVSSYTRLIWVVYIGTVQEVRWARDLVCVMDLVPTSPPVLYHCIQPIIILVSLLTKYFIYILKMATVKCRNM